MDSTVASRYKQYSPRELILKKPGMYIGSMDLNEWKQWIFDQNTGFMTNKSLIYSHGLLQIFREILMNAFDQYEREETGVTKIKVEIKDRKTVIIYNNGKGIPVVIHPEHNCYVPEMLFSHFASSGNYNEDEERLVSGTHGIGAKATVIFSKIFEIETCDGYRKFRQVYKNNLTEISKPKITDHTSGEQYTKIEFIPDFSRFGLEEFDNDIISMIEKSTYDIAALTGSDVTVSFNGKKINIKNFTDYVTLFVPKKIISVSEKIGRWEYVVCKSEIGFAHISFVNGMPTPKGGRHIDYIANQIAKGLATIANTKKKNNVKIKESDIKGHMMLFLNCKIVNPEFPNQIKEELATNVKKFGSTCNVSTNFIKMAMKTGITEAALSLAEYKDRKTLDKTDGKKKKDIGHIEKLVDANWAGTKKSSECTLILTEGDSAKASVMSGIKVLGRDKFGVFPLRGKLINVRERGNIQVGNNKEVQNIKKILGLRNETKDTNDLRYGKILIMTDADVDGAHIKGLFINFVDYYWRNLLISNKDFITCMATPILKAKNGKKVVDFYSIKEYNNWKLSFLNEQHCENSIPVPKGWTIKYYKGLGTSTKDEFIAYFQKFHIIRYKWNVRSEQYIKLAFEQEQADLRKNWLKEYNPDKVVDYSKNSITYEEFIDDELKHFSVADNRRSIPSLVDGQKPSQRKIVFAAFKKKLFNDLKVAQFAGYISEKTCYHHGEASLMSTIISLAQNFVGSNNLNILEPKGQFGTRLQGGKDSASARYIFTHLSKLAQLLFIPDDFPLLKYLDDDGTPIEPLWYVPILPLILINGCKGVGTGYSTEIPNYNINDIIECILLMMDNKKPKKLKPYFSKFKGTIEFIDNKYVSFGKYKVIGNFLEITELPIKVWTDTYKEFLMKEKGNGSLIKDIKEYNTDEEVRFLVEFNKPIWTIFNNSEDLIKRLKLSSNISITNMHLYDSTDKIKKYNNPQEILDEFYKVRLLYYNKRKEYKLEELQCIIKLLTAKARYIKMIVNDELIISKRPRNSIEEDLIKFKFDKINDSYDYLLKMPMDCLTKEKIEELEKQCAEKQEQYQDLLYSEPIDLWKYDLNQFYEEYRKM